MIATFSLLGILCIIAGPVVTFAGTPEAAVEAAFRGIAKAAELIARAFTDPYEGLTARTYGPPGLEEDIRFCAREDVLDVVPRFVAMDGVAAVVERV